MSRKHKKIFTTLNYIKQFLILASAITGFISISGMASFLGILIEITDSAIRFKLCAVSTGIKMYQSLIKKKKKSMMKKYC